VTVPSSTREQNIFHGIRRWLRHISVVICMSAGGNSMILFLVSSQVTDAVVRNLKTKGFRKLTSYSKSEIKRTWT
jgi:hypothetical protein